MELDAAVAAIAADEVPGASVAAMLAQLDDLARAVRMPPSVEPAEAVARLNLCLFDQHGFTGDVDDYEHPRNSYLCEVLERRRGLPILLSVIYIEVARRCGVRVEGVGFPGHFLVAPADAEREFFVDPFNRGRILTTEALTDRMATMAGGSRPSPAVVEAAVRRVGARYILVRINNNLKGAHLRRDDVPAAIRAVRRMLSAEPHIPSERRDLALMTAYDGHPETARLELEAYLEEHPDAPGAEGLRDLAERLALGLVEP
ncbi:MAG: tetratricopeptide repeat protein [Alphaproteobacteria bacterium]|nr:tetratricopeptide repeat protein [Alphaproteobacteria bacterium]